MAAAFSLSPLWTSRLAAPSTRYRISRRTSEVLDCSRWIAAGMVVLYHIRLNVLVDRSAGITRGVAHWLIWIVYRIGDCGPQAVLWFFVISGFLIGGKVVDDIRQERFDLARYAIARISRLYMVLIPALLIGYGFDLARIMSFGINDAAGSETAMSYGLPVVLANLLCLQTITVPTLGSNLPLWSLACEAWYYVLFPLLVLIVTPRRGWRQKIPPLVVSVAIVLLLLHNPKILVYFLFWLLGVAVWFWPAPIVPSRPLAWFIAVASMATYPALTGHLKLLAMLLVALSFANVLATEMRVGSGANKGLSFGQWHTYLAGFSYSLYLTHAPLLHLMLTVMRHQSDPRLNLQPYGWAPVLWALCLLLLIYGYAWLFSRLTEAHTARLRSILHRALAHTTVPLR